MNAVPHMHANVKILSTLILFVTRKSTISPVQVTKKNIMSALILVHMAAVTFMHADVLKNASITGPPTMLGTSSMMVVMS